MYNNSNEENNELAKVYLKLYKGCIDYKKNTEKDINCENYYKVAMFFSSKTQVENHLNNNSKSNK